MKDKVKKFYDTLNEFKRIISLHKSTYKYVSRIIYKIDNKIASLCIIFQPHCSENYEIELTPAFKIVRDCIESEKALESLERFFSGEGINEFAFNPEDLIEPSIVKEYLRYYDDSWKTIVFQTHCSKIKLEDLYNNFSELSTTLKERFGKSYWEFLSSLNLIHGCKVDSSSLPIIRLYAPRYIKIHRLGLEKDKIKVYIKAHKSLGESDQIKLIVWLENMQGITSQLKRSITELKSISERDGNFGIYELEIDSRSVKRVQVMLKDVDEIDYNELDIEKILEAKQKAVVPIAFRLKIHWKGILFFLVVALIGVLYHLSLLKTLFGGILSWINDFKWEANPNTIIALATIFTAIATLYTAYISKKQVKLMRTEIWRETAKAALEKLDHLEKLLQNLSKQIKRDEFVHYSTVSELLKYLELEPHIDSITFNECPVLRLKLSKLIKLLIDYNASVDRKKAKKCEKCLNALSSKIREVKINLCKNYMIKMEDRGIISY